MNSDSLSRRDFVKATTAAAAAARVMAGPEPTSAAPTIVKRRVLGGPGYQPPSDTLNIAAVGAGGMGAQNMRALTSENIVAICDVDFEHVHNSIHRDGQIREDHEDLVAAYEKARHWDDYRVMLNEQSDIDAVVIATPDHSHAPAASMAMQLGKHVYVQKPLTWSVHEARVLNKIAAETGVVTQMGNQGHSTDASRRVNEWIQAGAIGPVRTVHVWTNRPVWPQGMPRPNTSKLDKDYGWGMDETNMRIATSFLRKRRFPKPSRSLNWDLFLGPAPKVEYHPIYQPFNWRGWLDWGTGALGDIGAHTIDHPFWALDLGAPKTIEASGSPWGADNISPWGGPPENVVSYPMAMKVHYEFAGRGLHPPVDLHWYDGGLLPKRSPYLPDDFQLWPGGGIMYEGEKGVLVHKGHGTDHTLYPASLMEEYADTPETYERVGTTHEMNWANACKGVGEAVSPFSYAGPLTEMMNLGIVAARTGYGVQIEWDEKKGEVTNVPEANQYLHREYREGWTI